MNIPEISVKRPVATLMLILCIVLIGVVAFTRLTVELMPDISFPLLTISTSYEGVAPEEIEKLLTKPIEDAVRTIPNVKKVRSTSSEGGSTVVVEFNWGTDLSEASNDVRDRLGIIKKFLPEDADSPVLIKMDIKSIPVAALTISSNRDLAQLGDFSEDVIEPQLERIKGVAGLIPIGGLVREFLIETDGEKLKAYGLSLDTIKQKLYYENLNITGGSITRGPTEFTLRSIGEYKNVKEIQNTVLTVFNGAPVYVKDIAIVKDTYEEVQGYARTKGKNTVAIIVRKESDANTVEVSDRVLAAIPEIEKTLPSDVKLNKAFDTAEMIRTSINSLQEEALLGAFFAAFLVFLFLRDLRPTIIITLSIPFSFLVAFILMYFQKFTLNILTLGGLMIALGRVVDDSIVVIENTYRHIQLGEERKKAAVMGANEVLMPISAATLTTVVVFLPFIFARGMAGELFKSFSLTVTYALMASLFVAITLVPMMVSIVIRKKSRELEKEEKKGAIHAIKEEYGKILFWSLHNRVKVLITAFLLFAGSLTLIILTSQEFMPKSDEGQFMSQITLPVGSSLEETSKVMKKLDDFVMKNPNVDDTFSYLGKSRMGNANAQGTAQGLNTGMLMVRLKDRDKRTITTDEMTDIFRDFTRTLPGVKVQVQDMGAMNASSPVEIKVSGYDLETLKKISDNVLEEIKKIPGIADPKSTIEEGSPELQIVYDRDRLSQFGLTVGQISTIVRTAVRGDVTTKVRQKGKEINLRVRLKETQRNSIEDIKNISISTPMGFQISLRDVADITSTKGYGVIYRDSQKRLVTISANLSERKLGDVIKDVKNVLANKISVPLGYFIEFGGQYEDMQETFSDLMTVLLMSIILIYMIMAAQFESLLHPFTILFSLPFAVTGAFLALFITGSSFDVTSFIGVILLMGIVVTNAIILVDYINQQRSKGLEITEAIITAGKIRLRPILMTAFATIFAMLPAAIGTGEGSEQMKGMAIAVIGGLFTSTILTLLIVPIVYLILNNLKNWLSKKRGHHEHLSGTASPTL